MEYSDTDQSKCQDIFAGLVSSIPPTARIFSLVTDNDHENLYMLPELQ